MATDPNLGRLTYEQVVAAASPLPRVFIEATPGSGKTTVAAQRFGAKRYSRKLGTRRVDAHRAVVAVSFTRSATWELHRRVRRAWGPTALAWPHRICTLDTLVSDLLTDLLRCGLVQWPGGHTSLDVHDSWKVLVRYARMNLEWAVGVNSDGNVFVGYRRRDAAAMGPEPEPLEVAVHAGKCTHDDVRYVLATSLGRPEVLERVRHRLGSTIRALIVDEVYDANDLDLTLIRLAAEAGVDVTIIGDPWQALYGFRGAKPNKVPELLDDLGMVTLPLTQSFRWLSAPQRTLATALRAGEGVTLPQYAADQAPHLDVVLACLWEDLWTTADFVLPLAWASAKGNNVEAASTLLLNQVTRHVLATDATYLTDALSTLGITDARAVDRLEPYLMDILAALRRARSKSDFAAAYLTLVAAMQTESGRDFPPKSHANYTRRLERLAARLTSGRPCIPGMTVHQAKGQEWDHVGIRLTGEERSALAAGLTRDKESHRTLYVAATRARYSTIDVVPAP